MLSLALRAKRAYAPLLLAVTAADANAHPPPGVGTIYFFGVIPTVLLLIAYLISLFRSRAPWLHKLWMGLALAASLMLTVVLAGNNTFRLPLYMFRWSGSFPPWCGWRCRVGSSKSDVR